MDIHREGSMGKPVKNNTFAIVDDNNSFFTAYGKGGYRFDVQQHDERVLSIAGIG